MKKIKALLVILIFIGVITGISCKTTQEAENQNDQGIEEAIAYTIMSLNGMAGYLSNVGNLLPRQGYDSNYNSTTGWWTFSITLDTGESVTLKIKFTDNNNNFHKFIGLNTKKIHVDAEGQGDDGSFELDGVITNIQLTEDSIIINGTITSEYDGYTVTASISNLKIKKIGGIYPGSGTVTLTIGNNTEATVTFDGTKYASATYTFNGNTINFKINLDDGTIS